MSCKSCQSTNQRIFESEMNIHLPEFKNIKRSQVLAFPNLVICLDCGFTETRVQPKELQELISDRDRSGGATG